MNWDQTYVISKNVVIRPQGYDHFVVTHSLSARTQAEFDSGALRGLSFFLQPRTLTEAFQILGKELNVSEQEFAAAIAEMIHNQLLVAAQDSAAGAARWRPEESGFGRLQSQHRMLYDSVRVLAYRSAIFQHVAGKTVLEIGCGSGILSIFAVQAGAQKVFAIEESQAILLAQEMAKANQCEDRIAFISGNSLDVDIEQPVDIIVHELIGKDPFHENMLIYIDDARQRFLKPGGRLIPQRFEVCCYGIECRDWKDPHQAVAQADEFNKTYGLDFAPYVELLRNGEPPQTRIAENLSTDVEAILTSDALLYDIDFYADLRDVATTSATAKLTVQQRGTLNAILIFFRAHLDETMHLSTSPYSPKTHWGWAIHELSAATPVQQSDQIDIAANIVTIGGRERIQVRVV